MIGLAFIQFCTLVLCHFLTYTCHFHVVVLLNTVKQNMMKYFYASENTTHQNYNDLELLNIPECTYNYTEYQDGLVSDDFT